MWSVSINRHSEASPFRFHDLLKLQEDSLVELRPQGLSKLLFAELEPVITLGRRQTHFYHDHIDVVSGERGGNETWHGPGQWTCFVLTPLESFTQDPKGVRKAVQRILRHTLQISKCYLPESFLREGPELGIWSERGKLVSVGLKISKGYITSGFSINCMADPKAFLGVAPCGLIGSVPDFLFRNVPEKDREAEFLKLPSLILESFLNLP